ncbi:piggyBac transposable element-derived protein 4, partial [Larimichthys crocea]|uniref:piggyBac transposable element-derived protein 4 n=1 Tax=Larimichthys crocea TaxID=215358 RepID=UPI000F602C88
MTRWRRKEEERNREREENASLQRRRGGRRTRGWRRREEERNREREESISRRREREGRKMRQLRRQRGKGDRELEERREEDEKEQEENVRRLATKKVLGETRKITWSSAPYQTIPLQQQQQRQQQQQPWPPGPTVYAASNVRDIVSAFRLFLTPEIDKIILEETNREGFRKYGKNSWKRMDEIDLHAYMGLLILAGVYRSRGEATASLWDAESGRAIFRATMSLKVFHVYLKLVRFDDRETRAERRASDKLAAVRKVWDAWVERLPTLYNPGPHVTVDEQLVPFRGRCSFRQYMPNKPARYGIKSWVACDARSSYAWKMQVYTGRKPRGGSEKNQATRVVLDVTEGLTGRSITCDNFFTSYELAQRLLLENNNTLLGTVRKNKPELPDALLALRGRRVLSSKFAFTRDTALVSYLAKKNKNVLLLSTLHARTADVVGRRQRADNKPAVILDYNSNKGGVDNLDKVVTTYSCRRMTARWPLAVFHNILDVSSYNAFVIWRELNPDWLPGKRNKRRVFLEQLGKAVVALLIEWRTHLPRAEAAPVNPPIPASKRKRFQVCPSKKDCKTYNVCRDCEKYICRRCALLYCPVCANSPSSSLEHG